MKRIRITKISDGDYPEWVMKAFVGRTIVMEEGVVFRAVRCDAELNHLLFYGDCYIVMLTNAIETLLADNQIDTARYLLEVQPTTTRAKLMFFKKNCCELIECRRE